MNYVAAPTKKIGYLSPLSIIDNGPYEFYRLAPDGVMMMYQAVGLEHLTAEDVERVYAPVDDLVRQFRSRGVDIVVQGGVPLPLAIGPAAHQRILARIAEVAGTPASSTLDCVIHALTALGLKRVAVANKWSEQLNRNMAEHFFGPVGIEVVGASYRDMPLSETRNLTVDGGQALAYQLGRAALESCPDADGLYIGGAAWLTLPVIPVLEREFGKPVVSNSTATIWSLCHRVGVWQPRHDHGMLAATP